MTRVPRIPVPVALALFLLAATAAFPQGFHLAVTTNLDSNDVSVIDTNTEIARIATGPRPFQLAMSPDGQFAYAGEDGFGTPPIRIDRVNLTTLAVEDVLTIGGNNYLVELEVSPDGRWLVAGEIYKATAYIIDVANWTVTATIVLCPICDGQSQLLFAAPTFGFSADSQTLYAATPVNMLLTLVDLATGTIVDTRPAQNSFGSPPYNDLERIAGEQLFLNHSDSVGTVRQFDIPGGTQRNLKITQTTVPDIAIVPSGNDTYVASGSITYGASDSDFLSLYNLRTRREKKIPSSESLRALRHNPLRGELWATCVGFVGFCAPFQIDVFNLTTLTKTHTLPGVSGASVLTLLPALSADFRTYYQPMGGLNKVLVIDTATKAVVTQIPVGTNPRIVLAQGDVGPHELQ